MVILHPNLLFRDAMPLKNVSKKILIENFQLVRTGCDQRTRRLYSAPCRNSVSDAVAPENSIFIFHRGLQFALDVLLGDETNISRCCSTAGE